MNVKESILEAVIAESKNVNLSKINTISVAKRAKTSEANLYRIFETKNNLLTQTFLYIDSKIGEYIALNNANLNISSLEEGVLVVRKIWQDYLDYFVKHIDYVMFYSEFRMSKFYTNEIGKIQEQNFAILTTLLKTLQTNMVYETISFNLFWTFILDTTLIISKRMAVNDIEYNDSNIELAFHLIFDGLLNQIFKNRQ